MFPPRAARLRSGATQGKGHTVRIEDAIRRALSKERMQTYETAMQGARSGARPLDLYVWNAHVSAALLIPLHICEVVVRNAVADALTRRHGVNWPWVQGFRDSLPNPDGGHNPRRELHRATARARTCTADVVPTLSFVFWQKMFTQRFDARLWSHCLADVLPGADPGTPWHTTRARMHQDLEQIRRLRNRIAHHEPIFARALAEDVAAIRRVVDSRCTRTAHWMGEHEAVTGLLRTRPL